MNMMQMDEFKLTVPSKPEYVGVIRLTLAAIASRVGFDIEKIEDMKVAVAEACTNAIIHGCHCEHGKNFNIDFVSTEEKLTILVYDDGEGCYLDNIEEPDLTKPKEGGLGIFIIKSLMDDVEIKSEKGKGMMIKMIKYLGDEA
ncbi:ATP-binding protein [Alkaliphilus oremlandii]|uniref:Putative anti-sigma regulatory factor, serine/threonine protein kinase n=1 Tax=Alkaliphilus oremlandii (strain OhILAs) TaxID=350688 RepID=A8MEA8_ALKOO|nr:ATP-binding protein [Alkaliphilus oremlandii]ABW17579.1 putative anti-sigma regulatory factor, serine/threonine protein kinase [Alkaliphilus oremlandii OhILAs]